VTTWEITVVEGHPHRVWRSANVEAQKLAQVVPVEVAARWRVVRQQMTVDLRKRVREDRN
jgi:hypothetical protein